MLGATCCLKSLGCEYWLWWIQHKLYLKWQPIHSALILTSTCARQTRWLWTTGKGGPNMPPFTSTGLEWSRLRVSSSLVPTSPTNYHGPNTPKQSWRGHDKRHDNAFSPSGDWRFDMGPHILKVLQLHLRELPDWLHHRLVWQLLGIRPLSATECIAYGPVHHWGQASCRPGPIVEVGSLHTP